MTNVNEDLGLKQVEKMQLTVIYVCFHPLNKSDCMHILIRFVKATDHDYHIVLYLNLIQLNSKPIFTRLCIKYLYI